MSQTAEPATGLKREMGLRDVSLFAIACIVGTRWIPAAAHAGPGSVMLWLAAALLFALPLAVAVGALAAKYPGCAGGLYVWTRGDFGRWHGFLCFWVYWMGIAFWLPTAALFYMGAGFYALGPRYAHFADNRAALLAAALVAIWVSASGSGPKTWALRQPGCSGFCWSCWRCWWARSEAWQHGST